MTSIRKYTDWKRRAQRAENHVLQLQAQLESERLASDGLRFRVAHLEGLVKCLERSTPAKRHPQRPVWLPIVQDNGQGPEAA